MLIIYPYLKDEQFEMALLIEINKKLYEKLIKLTYF